MVGIYKITNRINNKSYIGQSVNIKRRWSEHRMLNRDETLSLKRAMRKYGVENFAFEVLEECSVDELCAREIHYIQAIKPEYNRCAGGSGPRGHCVSAEVKKILREKGKEQWRNMSPEQQKERIENNLVGPRKGHPVSKETCAKLRAANLGKKQERETIEKRIQSIKSNNRKRDNAKNRKPVYCLELDMTFESVKQAAEYINARPTSVSSQLKGRQKTTKGYHFSYVV